MALYYKFLSARDYDSISMSSPFMSVSEVKQHIFESKYKAKKDSDAINGLCFGTDFDIVVINAETKQQYANDSMLIPKNSKVLIRRIPGGRGGRYPIDTTPIVVEAAQKINNTESNGSDSNNPSNDSTVTTLSMGGKSNPVPAIPPELICCLCRNVMSEAVISSKCCFRSFCDKCMRHHLVELKSVCVCGATNMLADYLIPNLTLRDTINRYVECGIIVNSGSSENSNGKYVSEAASACGSTSQISSTTTKTTVASWEERKRSRVEEEDKENVGKQMVEKASIRGAVDECEGAVESSKKVKAGVSDKGGRKKKKRKMAEVECNESYTMPNGYYGYYPNWVGMNMEGYMPYNYGYYNGLGVYSAQYGNQNNFYSYQMGPR